MRALAFVRTLCSDQRGAALIEGAFAIPLLAFLMLGASEMARAVAFQQKLEEVASRALERATAVGNASSEYAEVRQDAATAAKVPLSDVALQRWLECDGARQTNYGAVCPENQQYARFVSVSVTKVYKPMFNLGALASYYGETTLGGDITMRGDALVRVQ